jgi:adenylate kinase family enzyme
MTDAFPFHRLVVVGTTSSGKSTLAKQIAERFGLDFVELDALHWDPNWTPAPLEVFRKRVETATRSGSWVVAGNYHVVRDLIWPHAEAVVWLDYSFPVVFWRLTARTFRRGLTGEELWNGNREKLWWHFKLWSDESLYHWLFKTYWRRKRETPQLLELPEHSHLQLIRLRSPRQADEWLATFDRAASSR